MSWLALAFALEVGVIREATLPVDLSSYVQMESVVTAFDVLDISGVLRSYQMPDLDRAQAWPFRMDYTIGASINIGLLSFGVEAFCYHPVDPFREHRFASGDGWYRRAFIRLSTIQD